MKIQLTILFVLICSLAFGQAFHGQGVKINKGVILQNGDSAFANGPGGIYINPTTGHIRFYQGSGFIGLSEAPEIGHKADTSSVWKRTGVSEITSTSTIRKTSGSHFIRIFNNSNFGVRLADQNVELGFPGLSPRVTLSQTGGEIQSISDSVWFEIGGTTGAVLTDNRNNMLNRRHGLRYSGDYSSAIRGTPNALTTMKTVRDVLDSINFITFSDTVSLIATKADISGISGDYWALSGDITTTGSQNINVGGNFINFNYNNVAESATARPLLTVQSVPLMHFLYNNSFGVWSFLSIGNRDDNNYIQIGKLGSIHSITARSASGSGIVYDSDYSSTFLANSAISKTYADNRLGGRTFTPPVSGNNAQSVRWNNTSGAWEYFTPGGGVSESQLEDSLSNYIPKSDTTLTVVTPSQMMDSIDSVLDARFLGYKIDTVNIMGWNMDTDQTKNVTLPVTNANLIAVLDVVIYHDGGTTLARKYQSFAAAGVPNLVPADLQTLSSTTFQLVRGNAGYFDSEFFDDDTINRGYMVIMYIP